VAGYLRPLCVSLHNGRAWCGVVGSQRPPACVRCGSPLCPALRVARRPLANASASTQKKNTSYACMLYPQFVTAPPLREIAPSLQNHAILHDFTVFFNLVVFYLKLQVDCVREPFALILTRAYTL
jgi:hypothetical protein